MDNSTKKALKNYKRKLPEWLTKKIPVNTGQPVRDLLTDLKLNTVCASARCPNSCECYGKNRATFLIMGPNCSRSCTFCAVDSKPPVPLEKDEPERVAEAVKRLGLKHAVITSVTRDDLPDGGAAHFARTIECVRKINSCTIEVLTPDFNGDENAITVVAEAKPDIFNHNVETVVRLYKTVRPQANYQQSLEVISFVKNNFPDILTKSGIMLGLGESHEEIVETMQNLVDAGCEILTIGQYLSPSKLHHDVIEYVTPERFAEYEKTGLEMGFKYVSSGPFVRSSYNAEDVFVALNKK